MESRRSAYRQIMAELARARQAAERGDVAEAHAAVEAALAVDPENLQALELRDQLGRRSPGRGPVRGGEVETGPTRPADLRKSAGWSTFEQRVRERRAARCVDAAHSALARGDIVAAHVAIAELGAVMPDHTRLPELRQLCATAERASQTAERKTGGWPEPPPPVPLSDASMSRSDTERSDSALPPFISERPDRPIHADAFAPLAAIPLERGAPVPHAPRLTRARRSHQRFVLAAAAAVLLGVVLIPVQRSEVDTARDEVLAESTSVSGPDEPEDSVAALIPSDTERIHSDETAAVRGGEATTPQTEPNDEAIRTSGSDEPISADTTATASSDRDRVPEDSSPAPAATTQVQQTASSARPRPETTEPRREDRSRETVRETQRAAVSEPATADPARAASTSPPRPSRPETPLRAHVQPAGGGPGSTVSSLIPDAVGRTVARVEPPPAQQPSPATRSSTPPAVAASYVPTPNPAAQAASARTQDGEAAIRRVLQRYIAAYNRLDAAAARDVWPSVNRSALERAFSQLDSQTLQFERCDVSVDEDGGTATCDGQARWVPRIGDRDPRRERRTWRFELARSGDDWIITRAEARR